MGLYNFVGGKVEKDEDGFEAAYRELREEIILYEEAHPLEWLSAEETYFDCRRFAGEGNIGYMVEQVKTYGVGRNNLSV